MMFRTFFSLECYFEMKEIVAHQQPPKSKSPVIKFVMHMIMPNAGVLAVGNYHVMTDNIQ